MRKLTEKEIENLLKKSVTNFDEGRGNIRWGQAMFNALYELYPEVAETVRGTEYDPFYKSERCVAFMDFITEQ